MLFCSSSACIYTHVFWHMDRSRLPIEFCRLGATSVEGFSSRCPTVWGDLVRAEQVLQAAGGNEGRPLDWARMFAEPASKLQGAWSKEISKSRRTAFLDRLGDEDAAEARSHGGPGAGGFLQPGSEGGAVLPDEHFTVSLCDRLLLPVCQEGACCQHRRPDGTLCNAPLDSRGRHAKKCAIGGGS